MAQSTNPLLNSLARRQEYSDGEEFIIDTGFESDELYVELKESENSAFIYTPDGIDDINVNLPKDFLDNIETYNVNNGIVTIVMEYPEDETTTETDFDVERQSDDVDTDQESDDEA
jgi:hypothetical protein